MISYEFIFVSKQFKNINLPKNLKLYQGIWADNEISDLKIRDIYAECFVSIILLRILSNHQAKVLPYNHVDEDSRNYYKNKKDSGKKKKFRDNKNIFLVIENNIDNWKKKSVWFILIKV